MIRYHNGVADDLTAAVFTLARGSRVLEHCLVDLTLPQVRVLRLLDRAPDRASAIAEKAAVSRPALTGVIDGLEKRGLLERTEVVGDRRGTSLVLTDAGRVALRAAEAPMVGRLAEVLASVPAADRGEIVRGLAKLGSALEEWSTAQRADGR